MTSLSSFLLATLKTQLENLAKFLLIIVLGSVVTFVVVALVAWPIHVGSYVEFGAFVVTEQSAMFLPRVYWYIQAVWFLFIVTFVHAADTVLRSEGVDV